MRTQDEIVKRIEERKTDDIFGFEWTEYILWLDFEHGKPYLKDEAKKEDWDYPIKETGLNKIRNYMEFAWGKANNCRGISASRSISHMIAWLWIDDNPIWEEVEKMYKNNYCYYGKDILVFICEKLDIDYKHLDDGIRTNTDY